MFLLKGGGVGDGVYDPTPYVPPLSSLSHSLFSLHPLHPLDSNGDNIVQQSCYDVSRKLDRPPEIHQIGASFFLCDVNGFLCDVGEIHAPASSFLM